MAPSRPGAISRSIQTICRRNSGRYNWRMRERGEAERGRAVWLSCRNALVDYYAPSIHRVHTPSAAPFSSVCVLCHPFATPVLWLEGLSSVVLPSRGRSLLLRPVAELSTSGVGWTGAG